MSENPKLQNLSVYEKSALKLKFFLAGKVANLHQASNAIAVAGSVGKTLTGQAIYSVLSQKFKIHPLIGDKDSVFAVPERLLTLPSKDTLMVLEYQLEFPGEMDRCFALSKIENLVVTNIKPAHSGSLGNIDQIFGEYKRLVQKLSKKSVLILNWDDQYVRKLADETEAEVIFYGTDRKKCHVWADQIKVTKNGTYFELNYGVERTSVEFKLMGRHTVYSALAAACLGISRGMSLFNIKKGLEKLVPLERRLRLLVGENDSQVLDDTYNSSPASLEEALNTLNELPSRKRFAVIGEMKDLGSYSRDLHLEVARKISKDRVIDFLLLSGQDAKIIADELSELGYPGKVEIGLSHSQIVSYILTHVRSGDTVLVKGDRSVKLGDVVQRISKQT